MKRFSFGCRKVIGFAFTTLRDWFKKLAPVFHPIRSKTKTNRDSLARVFPHFVSATCNYFVFWLVHLIICVLCDWLQPVITLVLVLRHSIENRSIEHLIVAENRLQHILRWLKICTVKSNPKKIQAWPLRYRYCALPTELSSQLRASHNQVDSQLS